MTWAWDDQADNKVVKLWHLKEELSQSGEVLYAKWLKDRATFFSKDLFIPLLRALNPDENIRFPSAKSQEIYDLLEDCSPQSTKALKKACDLKGRDLESEYQRSMRFLWRRLLILGWGEVDEGAFPSLNIVATKHFFEKEFREAFKLSETTALKKLEAHPGFQVQHQKWLQQSKKVVF